MVAKVFAMTSRNALKNPPTHPERRSLGEALNGFDNALNFIRLVLASSVIVSHAFPLTGIADPSGGYLEGLGGFAVNGFFIVSGYLIAASRVRMGLASYLWRRSLRIFPAFWTMLLLTGFVFAPLVTVLTAESWTAEAGWAFVWKNALLRMNLWGVPGTLTQVPYPDVWNGSAWTLFYEFVAYLMVGGLLTLGWVQRRAMPAFAALFASIVIVQALAHGPLDVSNTLLLEALRLGGYFVVGSLFYFARDHVPVSIWLGFTSAILLGLLVFLHQDWWFGQIPFAYLILWMGSTLTTRIGSRNDISYGIYIYAFPMQQFANLLVGVSWGWVGHSLLAFALTVPLAVASWFCIEKPAMTLRRFVSSAGGRADLGGGATVGHAVPRLIRRHCSARTGELSGRAAPSESSPGVLSPGVGRLVVL